MGNKKQCTGPCGLVKCLTSFSKLHRGLGGRQSKCKSCVSEYDDKYREKKAPHLKDLRTINYKKNREQVLAAQKAYRARNKEKKAIADKNYRERNKQRLNLAHNARCALRKKTDPVFRVILNLRWRVCSILKGHMKAAKTMDLIGCTKQDLMVHLQNQFRPGMSWNNYGPVWHVDHIKPLIRFRMEEESEQRKAFHYTNLQPLFALENILKSSKHQEESQ